nr:beta-eliminating lyase-related protein [Mesorhizobium sp.]
MQSNATRLDFRSDTVTRPTPQMRAAMGAAKVSDDVLGDDFTVKWKAHRPSPNARFGHAGGCPRA